VLETAPCYGTDERGGRLNRAARVTMDRDHKIVPEEDPTCPRCHESVTATARFCSSCGARVAFSSPPASGKRSYLEEERRQITVLFCDMVGSTEMSGRLDIEDYREVVQLYQQTVAAAIATFSGHVAQYLGDGVVAYFGWPLAYGDDAERAVRAGLEILEALNRLSQGLHDDRKIVARVGIHTGPVLVAKIGIGPGHEVAALGETPNVASRAQGLAPPDSVVITGTTMRLISRHFVGEPLGNHPLKGVAQPVALYRVRRATETRKPQYASREGGPFVGREAELVRLGSANRVWCGISARACGTRRMPGSRSCVRRFRSTHRSRR
jgi:class 3 adenylate cyclase